MKKKHKGVGEGLIQHEVKLSAVFFSCILHKHGGALTDLKLKCLLVIFVCSIHLWHM